MRNLTIFDSLRFITRNFFVRFGSAFFAFGMIFVLVFVDPIIYNAPLLLVGNNDVDGTIVDVSTTNTEINEQDAFLYKYTYTVEGKSYLNEFMSTYIYNDGDILEISHSTLFPSISAPLDDVEYTSIFTMLFPLVGLILIKKGLKDSREKLYIFKHGKITKGILVEKKATGLKINNETVFEYVFEVKNSLGKRQYVSHESLPSRRIEDDSEEIILYVENRNISIPVDALPDFLRNRIDSQYCY